MRTLQGLALLATLLGAGLLGYKIGSWSLADARAQLEAIDRASREAELKNDALRERIDQELNALNEKHQLAAQQLGQRFQDDKLALSRSLATTGERLSELQAKRLLVAAKLEAVLKDQELAAGAHKEELRKKEQELQELQAQLENARAGLDCLSIPVPANMIHLLNGDEQSNAEGKQ